MANVLIELFQDIADAIRHKTGETEKIKPADFPHKIATIKATGTADISYVTFVGADGTVLYTRPCINGDDCYDPVVTGALETPTKESTAQLNFTYSGWSLTADGEANGAALKAVTEDRTVYAVFESSLRKYAIRFYDGETLLATQSALYGATPSITNPQKSGYVFTEWSPSLAPVTGDADYYAQWEEKVTFAGSTWGDIVRVVEEGNAGLHFVEGETRTETLNYADGTSETITLTIARIYELVPRMTIASNVLAKARAITADRNVTAWSGCEMRTWCNNELYNALPSGLRQGVKKASLRQLVAANGTNNQTTDQSQDYLWLMSTGELHNTFNSAIGKIGYKQDATSPSEYWTRDGAGAGDNTFWKINIYGDTTSTQKTQESGVRFAFNL